MGSRALDIADLEFQVGDHVCAFYNGGGSALDDIVVDYEGYSDRPVEVQADDC